MSEILLYYRRPDPTTWVYLSSFLTIGLFFVFHRFWSVRNLDLFLLILLAPGLLIVHTGYRKQLEQVEAIMTANEKSTAPNPTIPTQTHPSAPGQERLRPGLSTILNKRFGDFQNDSARLTLVATEQDVPVESEIDELSAGNAAEESNSNAGESNEFEFDPAESEAPDDKPLEALDVQRIGFVYLFFVELLLLVRLMLDPLMVRRPLLDPNLTSGGLTFIGIAMFIFLMANVVFSDPRVQVTQGPALGPGYPLMNMLPAIPTRPISDAPGGASPPELAELTPSQRNLARVAKTLAILAQFAIITGIVLVGNRHFGNFRAGVGCAVLYLILPYTAQTTGRVDHVVPAALLLWAVLCYRRPVFSGILLGLACGLVYYPMFLLPLWFSFYWQKGVKWFTIGVFSVIGLLVLALSVDGSASLGEHLQRMFGLFSPLKDPSELRGFWALGLDPIWRLPVIVAFVILCAFFAIWPAQKNLGTLLSGSAAVMVAAQFWHGYGGGLYIAWFLPLLLLTIFRPNLQDRVATKVVVQRYDNSMRSSPVGGPRASLS